MWTKTKINTNTKLRPRTIITNCHIGWLHIANTKIGGRRPPLRSEATHCPEGAPAFGETNELKVAEGHVRVNGATTKVNGATTKVNGATTKVNGATTGFRKSDGRRPSYQRQGTSPYEVTNCYLVHKQQIVPS